MIGFPSSDAVCLVGSLDLNAHLIKNPAATFLMRAEGDLLLNTGIHSGDILVVDKCLEPSNGRLVVVALEGRLTAKRLQINQNGLALLENEPYAPIPVNENNAVEMWGVVTNIIHSV